MKHALYKNHAWNPLPLPSEIQFAPNKFSGVYIQSDVSKHWHLNESFYEVVAHGAYPLVYLDGPAYCFI